MTERREPPLYRKKLIVTAACLLLSAGLLVTGTLAWLTKSRSTDGTFTVLSDFEVTGTLSFGNGTAYNGSSILVPISFNPESSNYIGNMKYVVHYTGASPALIRVRVLEQWTGVDTNEVLSVPFLQYHVSGAVEAATPPSDSSTIPVAGPDQGALAENGVWIDYRAVDYCYYYSVPVQPKQLPNSGSDGATVVGGSTVALTLIDQAGGSPLSADSSTEMGLIIEVEAVQPNRYREFWGMDVLPQPPTAP